MSAGDHPSLIDQAKAAINSGDLLSAYDIARRDGPMADLGLSYVAILAIARMGETDQALRLYEESGLAKATDVDSRSLGARLLKDQALEFRDDVPRLRRAADAYAEIYGSSSDPFPAINAATLNLLAGDADRAGHFAQAALSAPSVAHPSDYYGAATKAEALTIIGRVGEAVSAIDLALRLPGADVGARSTTLRQFRSLLRHLGASPDLSEVISRLTPPAVVTFSGHIFKADVAREEKLAAEIDHWLETTNVGFGYGALAAGADILIAERLLARGSAVNIVFPFKEEDFIAKSVLPAGDHWMERYQAVRKRAAGISFATLADYVDDPGQFGYGSTVAMGLVKLRALHLGTRAVQLAIWDGMPANGPAGTGYDVAQWRSMGGPTFTIDADGLDRSIPRPKVNKRTQDRHLKAFLFADFPGFTRISEAKLPLFWSRVMTVAGSVLGEHQRALNFSNSWGDAVFAVFDTAEAAADTALALQAALLRIAPSELGLSHPTQMRISLHFGPVYVGDDPITGGTAFYGTEISRAARVEALTPAGSVYASEAMVAILAHTAAEKYRATYVGKVELPKGFGQYPLYALRRERVARDANSSD